MASSEIRATLTLDCSGFTSALQSVTANINKMTGQGTKQTSSLGTSFVNAGKQIQNVGVRAAMAGGAIQAAFKPLAKSEEFKSIFVYFSYLLVLSKLL